MTATKALGFRIFYRIVTLFFLLVITITLFEIVFIVSGFPEIHSVINPSTTFLASGVIACFYTFYSTRRELEEERLYNSKARE